jgi:hypothetical protein
MGQEVLLEHGVDLPSFCQLCACRRGGTSPSCISHGKEVKMDETLRLYIVWSVTEAVGIGKKLTYFLRQRHLCAHKSNGQTGTYYTIRNRAFRCPRCSTTYFRGLRPNGGDDEVHWDVLSQLKSQRKIADSPSFFDSTFPPSWSVKVKSCSPTPELGSPAHRFEACGIEVLQLELKGSME